MARVYGIPVEAREGVRSTGTRVTDGKSWMNAGTQT